MSLKITIITVVRNGASTIARTIESVLAQEWCDVEHVIVDGVSTDGTIDIVRAYAEEHPYRIKYISEPDSGIYDAMNKGINMSTGDIVGILNSDDFYHRTDSLSIVAQAFQSDKALKGVYADVRMVHPDDIHRPVRHYSSARFRPWMFRLAMMPAHPTFFTYRSVFEQFGLYRTDLSIAADFEMLLRLILVMKLPVKYLPVELLTMLTGGISDSGLAVKMEINRQDLRALLLHGIKSCIPLLWLRYPVKLLQYL